MGGPHFGGPEVLVGRTREGSVLVALLMLVLVPEDYDPAQSLSEL